MTHEKEVKVRIPVAYHVKLHSMRVLTGQQISDTVTEALRCYFEGLREARRGGSPAEADAGAHGGAEPAA